MAIIKESKNNCLNFHIIMAHIAMRKTLNYLLLMCYCFAVLSINVIAHGDNGGIPESDIGENKQTFDSSDHPNLEKNHTLPEWDPNGYVLFCLCMGRYLNVTHLESG